MTALLPYLSIVAVLVVGGVISPVPEEALLAAVGVGVVHGDLAVLPAIGAGIVGVVLGDVALFLMGRATARGTACFGLRPSDAMRVRAERARAHWGLFAVVLARLVPGLRGAVFFAAGGSGAGFSRVFALDLMAAVVHVPVLVAIGGFVARKT